MLSLGENVTSYRRTLRYVMMMSPDKNFLKCEYFVNQSIPAEMYVDTDQLRELKLFGKVNWQIF